ncbi:MAG: type II toxin-antitoxin system HicB family antitoxin [bacterium]
MQYDVVVEHCQDGSYFGYAPDMEDVMATADSRSDVLNRIRKLIHYQLEYCPCSFIDPERVDLDITEREGPCEYPT